MSKCDNKNDCSCTYPGCERHGKCCECISYHRKYGEFPACFFSKEGEKSYDRSFENLINDRKNR
uniref:Cytosolic protein n=1 Tax=candidate division WOR-3 bacterium TaxID=2052148 RepID=A0A7C3J5P8_UNCW3